MSGQKCLVKQTFWLWEKSDFSPFYSFLGVLAIYIYQSQINLNKLKVFVSVFVVLFIFSPFAYAYVSLSKTDKRTDYPGEEEANKAKLFYESQSEIVGTIGFVKGNEWIAGNLSYHLEERPKWIYDPSNIYLCNKEQQCTKYKWLKIK